jgi:leucyl aminopeptidase
MKELGMNAYLAVGQGSQNESLMSVMEYKGNPEPGRQAYRAWLVKG